MEENIRRHKTFKNKVKDKSEIFHSPTFFCKAELTWDIADYLSVFIFSDIGRWCVKIIRRKKYRRGETRVPREMRSWRTRPLTLSLQESSITFLLSQARRSLSNEHLFSIVWSLSSQFDWNSCYRARTIELCRGCVLARCIHREAIDRDAAWWRLAVYDVQFNPIHRKWSSEIPSFFFYEVFTSIHAWDVTIELKLMFLILVDQTIDKDIGSSRTTFRWKMLRWKLLKNVENSENRRRLRLSRSHWKDTAACNVLRHV